MGFGNDRSYLVGCTNIGGRAFVAKPVKLDDLITCIENKLDK